MVRRNDYALHRICLRSSRVELQDEAQMTGTKMVRVKLYRGIQIQFWDSGSRWFAFAPGQRRDAEGHPTPEQALETAERFIDQSIR